MSVTGNFFSRLRSLATTLEKETAHLEQVFGQEDDDYEDESPMRVLHDLRSETMGLKSDIQGTLDKSLQRGQELNSFLKICRVLQQRNASDIQQVKDTFQTYGYKPRDCDTSETEVSVEPDKSESTNKNGHNPDLQDLPPPPVLDNQAAWDLMRGPQLSDFGLSHYQLPSAWDPHSNKLHIKNPPEEKPKPLYDDSHSVPVAKTPKCALRMEDDFSQIQHFGISDYSTNLNDDYTIALINKKKGSCPEKSKEASINLKNMLAAPAHLTYRNDFSSVYSPQPPVFCTPGLKVQKKDIGLGVKDGNCETNVSDNAALETGSTRDMESLAAPPAFQSLSNDMVDSPHRPTFCTPGLKVHQKEMSYVSVTSPESKEEIEHLDTPPVPSFETKWLKSDTMARSLDITEPIPRPQFSHSLYLEEAAPTKAPSPPKMRDFCIVTPTRPEMTICLTEDLFKLSMKPAPQPKMSDYEKLLWTPVCPEMTSCVTIGKGSMENKENRMQSC